MTRGGAGARGGAGGSWADAHTVVRAAGKHAAPVPLADEPLAVTTSVGVASGVEDGWEGLVRRADTGLYAAKEGGRDRVVAGPPAGSRPFTPEGQDAARYR